VTVHADLQRLTADNLLANVGDLAMDRLRSIRAELTAAESDVSMVRRMTQGRLDIVGHGLATTGPVADGAAGGGIDGAAGRGSGGAADGMDRATGGAGAADGAAPELLFDMPDILSEGPARTSRGARIPEVSEPGPVALELIERLDSLVAPSTLSDLGGVERLVLTESFERLREFELELSGIRRSLHERIDALQGEIARRYRDGEASVDALLSDERP
jgi:hypothetical protein